MCTLIALSLDIYNIAVYSSGMVLGYRGGVNSELGDELDRTTDAGTVGIVGNGVIGASIGLALKPAGFHVVGYDSEQSHSAYALSIGAIDAVLELDDLAMCDAVFVATPVDVTIEMTQRVLAIVPPSTTVIDTCSVKGPVVAQITAVNFVGSHPMRGSHLSGPAGARPGMFVEARWILSPSPHTQPAAIATATNLVLATGAKPRLVPADVHDAMVARGSHLPHVVASAPAHEVAGADPPFSLSFTGGGFRDATRIARAPADLWTGIVRANADAVVGTIDDLVQRLVTFRHALSADDEPSVHQFFADPAAVLATHLPEPNQP